MVKVCALCEVPFEDTTPHRTARFCSDWCRTRWERHKERENQRLASLKQQLLTLREKLEAWGDY